MDTELKLVPFKKFAVGYNTEHGINFPSLIQPYLPTISEVFFAWPTMGSGRTIRYPKGTDLAIKTLLADCRQVREWGIKLDILFNANCYGEGAFSPALRQEVYDILEQMRDAGCFPEIVTTSSPFIARCIKVRYPEINVRASVNMKLESSRAMEMISYLFDSFYVAKDVSRDLESLKYFSEWGKKNGKDICILVNSACLRSCPAQIWHDNMTGHVLRQFYEEQALLHFPVRFCEQHFEDPKNAIDYLRMTWIRPEDIRYYEPYVSVMKLATRGIWLPQPVLKAYCTGSYDGNVLDYIGSNLPDIYLDNKSFPDDWVASGIAQKCAINCTHCGRCQQVFDKVFRGRLSSGDYTITPRQGPTNKGPYTLA